MTLDIYTSISNQFKPEGDVVDQKIRTFFRDAGYNVELRRFQGGGYSSKKVVVRNPDVLVVHVDEDGSKVGKGSCEEKDYALKKGIPVLLASVRYIYKYTGQSKADPTDWRHHVNLDGQVLSTISLRKLLKEAGIGSQEGTEDPFFDQESDHQKGSDKNMLL